MASKESIDIYVSNIFFYCRLMLHQLSEHMLQDNVKKLNNCMQYLKVPPAKLQQANDAYSLFTLLEKQDIIDEQDVSKLLELFTQMDEKDLIQIVQKYIGECWTIFSLAMWHEGYMDQ